MKTNNMNYMFNVEYYEGINLIKCKNSDFIGKRNSEIVNYSFKSNSSILEELSNVQGFSTIDLYTVYPGMLVGVGNPHDVAIEGAIKCGFSFDYVSGLPYIPGSSLKGMLRSYFPDAEDELIEEKKQLIKDICLENKIDLKSADEISVKKSIFENNDIFIGGYPILEDDNGEKLLAMEYITPHTAGPLKNPNPISMIKIRPNVKIRFAFILHDDSDTKGLNVSDKLVLFKEILLLGGIGAKTNVGFGGLSDNPAKELKKKESVAPQITKSKMILCQKCKKNECIGNYRYCPKCYNAIKKQKNESKK